MADETISTRIVANADFSALIADVHKVTASLSKLQEQLANSNKMLANQIAVMNRSFSDTLRSTGQFSTHFVSLQSDVEKFGKNLDGGKLKLNQYFNTFRQHAQGTGGLIRELAKQQVMLQNSVLQPLGRNAQGLMQFNVNVPRGLDEVKNKTAIARQELQIMNKVIQDGAGQLINWGKNTQWAGRQLTVGLTVPLAAFGKAAADAFRAADEELVRLTKVYGDVAGTSTQELGKVREQVSQTAKEISAAMGVSFKETIGLAADIAATGKTGDELLGSIKETTRLAVLGEVDRQEAMKATLAIQSAFKQNTEELSQSINFLNAVENQTSTTLNDLVEAIPKAGPVIQGLGGSVQDLALYLTAMREGGINASEGANALKSALASLINPTDVAVAKFKGLGIDLLGIVNNNAGNLTGTLMALQGALDTLDPLKKQQAIEQLFGKFQFARLNALFENLGRQGSQTLQVLDLMKASSEDLAAVAGRELTAVTESASGKYRRALESLKASLADVGEQFLTINTTLIQVIDKVVQFATNLPKPIKQVLALVGGITAIAGPLIMITGVLANFFGYIMKGVFHMKAFFKGGEGWKYLTPEMLAAEKAGKLVEQSFYSDAKAAAVLKQALGNLIDEFSVLEAKAKAGALSVNPAVSTMAGNLVMAAGGGRVVDPNHPLAGPMGTRASSHMVPRSGMSEQERLAQTMFGMVPGSGMVNQKIGQNPQIYMNDALPSVPGLTTVNGVSTGIVSGEAARWHSMMATLAMQSKAEIEMLKKQIVATGTVSKEFMMQFDDILPVVSKLTDNAARESAVIVAELRAGKLTVEAAKAKIIALNLETERMITSAVGTQAAAMGRTINPTMVPTLNQPVVDPTGKSNMRELFKKGKTKDFINRVAGALGVRTSGAGYNIETTRPRKMNSGGYVYTMNDGNIVPGPNVNADVVPAMLTPGEFVVNRESAQANLPLLTAINNGYNNGGAVKFQRGHVGPQMSAPGSPISGLGARSGATSHISRGIPIWMTSTLNQETRAGRPGLSGRQIHGEFMTALKSGRHPFEPLITAARASGMPGEEAKILSAFDSMMNDLKGPSADKQFIGGTTNSFENHFSRKVLPRFGRNFQELFMSYGTAYGARGSRSMVAQGNVHIDQASGRVSGITGRGNPLARGISSGILGSFSGSGFGGARARLSSGMANAALAVLSRGRIRRNSGGMIPGYNRGGMVSGMQYLQEGGEAKRGTGGMGMFLGGMGLQMAGGAVDGTAGMVMQSAGTAMQFMPMLSMLPKLTNGTKILSGTINTLTSGAKKAAMALRAFALANPGLLAATAALTAGIAIFKLWKKSVEDAKRNEISLFGISEKGAKEVGITYTSLTDKVKALREEQKLAEDKAKAYFESYSASGVKGLTLTIQQLKELKERVKTDMPETMAILNDIDSTKVNDWASNLKAQMISSGKSVEEATNLIYALIESSNKAGQGVSAISSKAFAGIADKGTAANFVLENLSKNIDNISSIKAEAFASNVDTAIASLDSAVQSLIGTKDATGQTIDEARAIAIQMESITQSGIKNKKLGQDTVNVLKSQRPEFGFILNKGETIGGMYAKWRLMLQGISIDLSQIDSAQAEMLATFTAGLDAAGANALAANGTVEGLEKARGVLKELQTAYDTATKASNTNSISSKGLSKAAIKGIQDEIKAIRERAEAKKRALRETFDKENAELELQQAKLDLQSAIARGDNEAAAAAQIRIQQIQKEASLKAAEAKIDDNARKEEAKQQAVLDKDAAYKEALSDAATAAGNKATNLGATLKTVNELGNELVRVAKLKTLAGMPEATQADKDKFTTALSNVLNDIAKSAKTNPKVLEAYGNYLEKDDKGKYKKDAKGNYIPLPVTTTMRFPKQGEVTMPGAAQLELSTLSNSMSDFALSLMGSPAKSLYDIWKIIKDGKTGITTPNGGTSSISVMSSTTTIRGNSTTTSLVDPMALYNAGYSTQAQTKFKDKDGKEWIITGPATSSTGYKLPVKKAESGGYATANKPLIVGDGGVPELFVPKTDGMIIPDLSKIPNLGQKFNIPSQTISSASGGVNSSYNNNTYTIDIQLNGTNVTADDIMRRFKAELALVNAKEGRSRAFGGSY